MTHVYRAARRMGPECPVSEIPLNVEFAKHRELKERIDRVKWWVFAFVILLFPVGVALGLHAYSLYREKKELESQITRKFENIHVGVPGIFQGFNLNTPIVEEFHEESLYSQKTGQFKKEPEILHTIQKDVDRRSQGMFYNGKRVKNAHDLACVCDSLAILELSHQGAAVPALELLNKEAVPKTERFSSGIRFESGKVEHQVMYLVEITDTINTQTVRFTTVFELGLPDIDPSALKIKAITVYDLLDHKKTTTFEPYFG